MNQLTTKNMRLMSWNIGSFIFQKYLKCLKSPARFYNEYFQPSINAEFVSLNLQEINPDVVCLQEFWLQEDADQIKFLKAFPYKMFIDTWYRKNSLLIASKLPFTSKVINDVSIIFCNELMIIPVHLNSFSAAKRLTEINKLVSVISSTNYPIILLGDTNIWSRGNKFIFFNDKKSYNRLTEFLVDTSREIKSTCFFGLGLDKIFTSRVLAVTAATSLHRRGKAMDHYPIYIDINYK